MRKKAKEIGQGYPGLAELISDMFETMAASDGIGLAAPQIGLSLRLIVIDASEMEDQDDPTLKDFKIVLINPRMLDQSGEKWVFNEGCLSFPDIREDVERFSKIRIQYFDENFNLQEKQFDGVKARIIQHEYDHLEGILFVDKIKPLRRRLLNGRLNAITKGAVATRYRTKNSSR